MSEIDWTNLTEQDMERIEKHLPVFAKKIKEEGGIEKWNQKHKDREIERAKQIKKIGREKFLADRAKEWEKIFKKWEESDEGKESLKRRKYWEEADKAYFKILNGDEDKNKSG